MTATAPMVSHDAGRAGTQGRDSLAHRVFLSHATEDRETALQVCAALEAEGIDCWIAPRNVEAGTDYAAAILEGIRTSELVLLIFSTHANASPYVLREVERAVAYGRPVLALRVDETTPSSSIEYYVHRGGRWMPHRVETKQDEIVAAVREAIGAPARLEIGPPMTGRSHMGRWTRRRWWIAGPRVVSWPSVWARFRLTEGMRPRRTPRTVGSGGPASSPGVVAHCAVRQRWCRTQRAEDWSCSGERGVRYDVLQRHLGLRSHDEYLD